MAVVETKVKASTAAAAVSGMALWALGRYVFKGSVPDVVASWVYVLVPGLLAWGAGYLAPHTPRAELQTFVLGTQEKLRDQAGNDAPVTSLPPAESTALPPLAQKTLQQPPGAGMGTRPAGRRPNGCCPPYASSAGRSRSSTAARRGLSTMN
jgi:hypothetical protein